MSATVTSPIKRTSVTSEPLRVPAFTTMVLTVIVLPGVCRSPIKVTKIEKGLTVTKTGPSVVNLGYEFSQNETFRLMNTTNQGLSFNIEAGRNCTFNTEVYAA